MISTKKRTSYNLYPAGHNDLASRLHDFSSHTAYASSLLVAVSSELLASVCHGIASVRLPLGD